MFVFYSSTTDRTYSVLCHGMDKYREISLLWQYRQLTVNQLRSSVKFLNHSTTTCRHQQYKHRLLYKWTDEIIIWTMTTMCTVRKNSTLTPIYYQWPIIHCSNRCQQIMGWWCSFKKIHEVRWEHIIYTHYVSHWSLWTLECSFMYVCCGVGIQYTK